MKYPTVINNFNVYDGEATNLIVGTTGEITLPDLETKTSTISGAGILGEIDEAVIGQFGPIKMEIPFRTISTDMFNLMRTDIQTGATLRGGIQGFDTETAKATMTPMKVVVKGKTLSSKPGKVKAGEQMDSSVTVELTYIKIEYDNEVSLELDKLNTVYTVNGVDMLEEIRNMM